MIEQIISIIMLEVLGIPIIHLAGVGIIAILSVLYVRWRSLKKAEDSFVDRMLVSIIDRVIDMLEDSENISSEEITRFLGVIKRNYISGPNETNNSMVEYIEEKQEEID